MSQEPGSVASCHCVPCCVWRVSQLLQPLLSRGGEGWEGGREEGWEGGGVGGWEGGRGGKEVREGEGGPMGWKERRRERGEGSEEVRKGRRVRGGRRSKRRRGEKWERGGRD